MVARIAVVIVVFSALTFIIGCGVEGIGLGGGGGAVEACRNYVNVRNGLECATSQLDESVTCDPTSIESNAEQGCDFTDFYVCLAENTRCENGILISSSATCSASCE